MYFLLLIINNENIVTKAFPKVDSNVSALMVECFYHGTTIAENYKIKKYIAWHLIT